MIPLVPLKKPDKMNIIISKKITNDDRRVSYEPSKDK